MKIKKYEAKTEQEAIEKVKEDLGKDALILNIKKISPKGIFKLFKKPSVEVLAALDDQFNKITDSPKNQNNNIISEQKEIIKCLESKLDYMEDLLTKVMDKVSSVEQVKSYDDKGNDKKYNSSVLQLLYDNLINNEILPELAEFILKDLDDNDDLNPENVNELISVVYNRIIDLIGEPAPIKADSSQPKIIFFIGPTGVGKTTTIAKITAHFCLTERKKVGLVTADTYRIAAVEQLKTYAEILNIPVEVIYNSDELPETLNKMKDYDLILIDTAGRSHKNIEQFKELDYLLSTVDEKQIFLVLSATTKHKDMMSILNQYSSISDYNIIFTKVDETISLGTILNVKYLTEKPLSYISFGQNVPDDIELISPKKMTKALLGSIDEL
ncbi:MAG TPA: flagellar biosynthesis protein FlhF [Defluviitaleaceae bacterium]|nr:flagellar biosynthesis protein FlhF [Defluviitaleaceae bacterium]